MSIIVDVQYAMDRAGLPAPEDFRRWVEAVLQGYRDEVEVTVRIVDEAESAQLNETYRRKCGPTNVLSFPFETPSGVPPLALLGDVVVCAPVVAREAREQGKLPMAHWAHMVVHGILHLLGYDHVAKAEAEEMEAMESELLGRLGYPNPYQIPPHNHPVIY
jgi:probable rRNA maturation factor